MRNPGSVVVQADDEAARWSRVSRVDWEEGGAGPQACTYGLLGRWALEYVR